jgi:adenylate cyclase
MTPERFQRAWVRPVRLWCGLILFSYLVTHFSNHALGLVSLNAMEQARIWFLALWRNPLSETALFGALLAHWLLGLWLLYRRRTLRMPAWEAIQIVFGLAVPPLLAYHLAGTRLPNAMFDTTDLYSRTILNLVQDPWAAGRTSALFLIAWVHGCIGLHFWLRLRSWYARMFPLVLMGFVLLPVLASLGIAMAGREVAALAQEPGFAKRLLAETRSPQGAQRLELQQIRDAVFWTTWALLALTLAARALRDLVLRSSRVRVRYFDGTEVMIHRGWSVLDASRYAGIAHASVCGGRGRCSTCRIRVAGDPKLLPPPAPLERRVLERIGASPNVRLACQLRPQSDVLVTPLLPATVRAHAMHVEAGSSRSGGQEREIAVLFADLRGFTRIAENRLPYDVVFILNRYFEAVGSAVALAGGMANQYTGDGVMALFGIEADAPAACRQALVAAGAMVHRVSDLGRALSGEVETMLRIGIGIHTGRVVVGEMGYGETRYLTAVGDAVNTASRLEGATKEYDCELVVSEEVFARAGIDPGDYPRAELALRNREATLRVLLVNDAQKLAVRVAALSSRTPDSPDPASAAAPATPAAPPPRA